MKAGQTSVRGGIEDILIPMENFKCTQGDFEGNHPYYACDMAGKDAGRELAYLPFSAVCKAVDSTQNGNAVCWESLSPVRFADGTIDYCVVMVIHDNDLSGIAPGVVYPQGHQMAQEGTAGFATGNHLHMEFAKGRFTAMYAKNDKGYYLPNGQPIENCCFSDGTVFINSANWNWKLTNDVAVNTSPAKDDVLDGIPSDFVYERATFRCTVDKINIRRAPSINGTLTGDWYENGMSLNYDGFVKRDGYVWISYIGSDSTRRWVAVREIETNKAYGTFS